MSANRSLLKDNVVLQSFGPLDESLHSGVTHIWLTFVVACSGVRKYSDHYRLIKHEHYHFHFVRAVLTCDERLCLTAAGEVGQRAFHSANSHLSAHQVGH